QERAAYRGIAPARTDDNARRRGSRARLRRGSLRRPVSAPLRLALHFICYFGWAGIMLPFFPVYLDAKGLSGTEIGILLGIGPWARFAVTPLVGPLADRRGVIRELIIGASLLAGVGLGLYLAADAFAALLLA